jgi:hypothetical protein
MTKQDLPQCSVLDCDSAAGVILDGAMFCGTHANEILQRRRAGLRSLKNPQGHAT